jgi:hypothetical protein
MANYLPILFENTQPIDIAQVRNFYPKRSWEDVEDDDTVQKQIRYLAKHLIGVSIPKFIDTLKQVVALHPTNRLKLLLDRYGDNLEATLLAENYDVNT